MKIDSNKLIELNAERLDIINSSEYFLGNRMKLYIKLISKFKFATLFKQFFHDLKSLSKKKSFSYHFKKDFNKTINLDEKIIIYTSIYGSYDEILEPLSIDEKCEYYIFTDREIPDGSVWKKADESLIPLYCNTDVLKNRYVKMHPHKLFNNRYSMYIDGNLQIVANPSYMLYEGFLNCKTGIAMHLSPRETSIYREADSACFKGKITKKEKKQILTFYKKERMPKNYGMFECNVILRDSNNTNCIDIMNDWWNCFLHGIKRDQLYFTYILYKKGYAFNDVYNYGTSVNNNPLFIRRSHING